LVVGRWSFVLPSWSPVTDFFFIFPVKTASTLTHEEDGVMAGSYKDLRAWKQSMELALQIYRYTESFPREERYGLTSQLRRGAVSVSSNIAEGKGRSSDKELVLFLHHARGSLLEVETQILIARGLKYGLDGEFDTAQLLDLLETLAKTLNALIRSLRPIAA
jgi:four helix bundle protein